MAKIDQRLIERLGDKLGIGPAAVYARIAKVANEMMLDRHLAALVLAGRHHINTNKYSTPEQRAEIRGAQRGRGGGFEFDVETEIVERAPARRPATKAKAVKKRAKDNTIFRSRPRRGDSQEHVRLPPGAQLEP
ncbi:hypothetical protein [Bradyrhizobium roseum]|uniref:hypothetical protein n=1 Tax=Bradyrhizobium roseum TaxID=3056648 RepID=UPI0026225467|nr:hypothetical protein [Bradyrhizobium roseus]WKA30039.1 hypothetical protein QUH67_07665 [Bradyrhizobium roseus]